MVNNVINRLFPGGIGRKAQIVLLLALIFALAVPGISHAEATISGAETKDSNADGRIDQVVVTLSEVPAQWTAADFQVEVGYRPILDVQQGTGANNVKFTLTLTPKASGYDTGATPTVSYKTDDEPAADKASPILVGIEADDQGGVGLFNKFDEFARLRWSEPVDLYNTDPNGAQVGPATSTTEELLALERGVVLGPTGLAGCGQDGDGTQAIVGSGTNTQIVPNRNFPSISLDQVPPPTDLVDAVTKTDGDTTIVVTLPEFGYDGSGNGRHFGATPESLPYTQHCTFGINATFNAAIADRAAGTVKNAAAARGGGAAPINHVKGELKNTIDTLDENGNGKVDGVAVSFNHPAKLDSVKRALDTGRFGISIGTGTAKVDAANLHCDACNSTSSAAQVKIAFDEVAAWNTAATPSVSYDGSGSCASTGVVVLLVNGLTECAAGFAQITTDKARPVVVGAKTRDFGDPAAAAAPNGKVDAIEVTFSEPVKDSSFTEPGTGGWSANGYTVTGSHTGVVADDAVAILKLSEVAIDTDKTSSLTYAQPATKVTDNSPSANLLANIGAPGVSVADGAGPALVGGSVHDEVGTADGRIDTVKLTFSEALLGDPIAISKIRVGADTAERSVTAAQLDAADAKVVVATITGGVAGTNAKDLSVQPGAVFDAVGNGAPALRLLAATVQDLAKPVIVDVTPRGQNASSVPVVITWSELMDDTAAATVTYGQQAPGYNDGGTITAVSDANHANGYLISDKTKWEGTAPVPDGGSEACLDPEGCVNHISVANAKGADQAPSAYAPDTRYTWTIDTVAPSAPPAFTSPASGAALGTSGTTRDVVVSGTSTEANLSIQVYEGDTLRGTALSNSTGNWSATLPTLGLGAHALKLRAVDAGGNASGFSGLRTIYVKQLTSLTLGRNYSSVTYGNAVKFSGVLRNAGGAALSNRTVTIQYIPAGRGSWYNLAHLRTNSAGAYSYAYKPSTSNTYRAVYSGEATFMNVISSSLSVPVRAAVSSAQSATSIRYGNTMTFTGGVRPGKAGKRVYLQVQNANKTWSNVGYVYLDRYSNYRFVYKPTVRGTRYYRIYYPRQDIYQIEGWSITRRLSVS